MRKNILVPLFILLALLTCACSKKTVQRESVQMATVMRQTLIGADEQAAAANEKRVAELEAVLSRTIPKSDVYSLNHAYGQSVKLNNDTYALLSRCKELAGQTGGAFDPTVGEITELWGIGTDHEGVPGDKSIASALTRVGYRQIELGEDNSVSIGNAQVDLGACAKGYALDQIAKLMDSSGGAAGVISVGGSVYARGKKDDGSAWSVGVRDPFGTASDYMATLPLSDEFVSTSGTYEQGFEQGGKYYSHIFDPKTARPVENNLVSVTVIGNSGADTDIYSTALFVMGLENGIKFADEHGIKTAFITDDKKVYLSKAMGAGFTLVSDGYSIGTL